MTDERFTNVLQLLQQLKDISGKNAKRAFLIEHKDNEDLRTLLMKRYNPYLNYKIKNIEVTYTKDESLSFTEFTNLLEELASRSINNDLRQKARLALGRSPFKYRDIVLGILTKELSLGVDTTINKAFNEDFIPSFDVMLAAPYTDIPFPCLIEEKLDGVRITAIITKGVCQLFTRQGRLASFPPIEKELQKFARGDDLTFDGELTVKDSRTAISGLVNSNLKKGYVAQTEVGVVYNVFDVFPTTVFRSKGKTDTQEERTITLDKLFLGHSAKFIVPVSSQICTSARQLHEINARYINEGKEGIIAKDLKAPYAYKRNKAWQKLKALNTATLKVIGVDEGKGKRKGKVGALICESEDGLVKVKVGSGLSDADVELFTKVSPIGKYAEVLYNVICQTDDTYYSLFLPRLLELRIDKSEADTFKKMKAEHTGKIELRK